MLHVTNDQFVRSGRALLSIHKLFTVCFHVTSCTISNLQVASAAFILIYTINYTNLMKSRDIFNGSDLLNNLQQQEIC